MKSSVKSQIASMEALRTPTDLSTTQVRAIATAVNPILADSFALYMKVKNFHWHLSGPTFRSVHLMLDDHAASILKDIDPLAERVRKLGALTLHSISEVSKMQSLVDDNDDFVPAQEMLVRLLKDNQAVAKAQRDAIDVCDENRDKATADLLAKMLDETEKRIWFLFELTQGGLLD